MQISEDAEIPGKGDMIAALWPGQRERPPMGTPKTAMFLRTYRPETQPRPGSMPCGGDDLNGFIGRAGGAVTLCQPAWLCKMSLTFASNVALVGPATIVAGGVGMVYHFDSLPIALNPAHNTFTMEINGDVITTVPFKGEVLKVKGDTLEMLYWDKTTPMVYRKQ